MQLNLKTIKLGDGYVAAVELGGITLRGKRADSAKDAIKNLLWLLSRGDNDDAEIGLELALAGTTIGDAMGELGTGAK